MQPGFSAITSSKYYHPAFNSAIFDGPIRIYFVQFHETYALKIYFALQEQFKESLTHYKDFAKQNAQTLLIMIYPTEDGFKKAFEQKGGLSLSDSDSLAKILNGRESIFGLKAPVLESNVRQLMEELSDIFNEWEKTGLAPVLDSSAGYRSVVQAELIS